jgi:hypothetical protein
MMARELDKEIFEDNPQDYIMIELEGSDSESRRRCSRDLLKVMCREFEARTTAICSEHITRLIGEFNADPTKWVSKDTAVSLDAIWGFLNESLSLSTFQRILTTVVPGNPSNKDFPYARDYNSQREFLWCL